MPSPSFSNYSYLEEYKFNIYLGVELQDRTSLLIESVQSFSDCSFTIFFTNN